MSRAELFSAGLRVFLSGGSGAHLMRWCKQDGRRDIALTLQYPNGEASWGLTLTDENKEQLFHNVGGSLESLMFQAVAAMGKG
jgi:hypothetical protein